MTAGECERAAGGVAVKLGDRAVELGGDVGRAVVRGDLEVADPVEAGPEPPKAAVGVSAQEAALWISPLRQLW